MSKILERAGRAIDRWLLGVNRWLETGREPDFQVVVNGVRFWSLTAAADEADWLEQHGHVPDVYLVRREADGSYGRIA